VLINAGDQIPADIRIFDARNFKGLSDEIDFKNFDKKFTELGLPKGRVWVLNFLGAPMIL
jgi:hypothetical protein